MEVTIKTDNEEDARRIDAVLGALGYTVLRDLGEMDATTRLDWAVERISKRHKLSTREQALLALVLKGYSPQQSATELGISRSTIKWHMHNIFAKTNTSSREELLRLAFQLDYLAALPTQPSFESATAQATTQLARIHGLSETEEAELLAVLRDEIELDRVTWTRSPMAEVFAKTGTSTADELLRLCMQVWWAQ